MRFLIISTDLVPFLHWHYATQPGLARCPYDEQMRARVESLYFRADFYSSNLRRLGHEAWDIYADNLFMQAAWAREHAPRLLPRADTSTTAPGRMEHGRPADAGFYPGQWHLDPRHPASRWLYAILAVQIRHYAPDVLLNQDMYLSTCFLREIRPLVRLLVGQHWSCQLPDEDYSCYDLAVSSFPPTVADMRRRGIPAALLRLGFEPRVLSALGPAEHRYAVTFVGGLYGEGIHSSRVTFIEKLCRAVPEMQVWGYGARSLPSDSPIHAHYAGHAWGRAMLRILRDSRLTVNHHGSVLPHANNMRLFEATGMGSLLITDHKENLSDMFAPGRDLVAYRTVDDCVELIRHYLARECERTEIARRGQQRTLGQHTYLQRMEELADLARRSLS
jgi:hypothetical protein